MVYLKHNKQHPILKGSKIMTNNTYNGWKNRETWLVNVWYGESWSCEADIDYTYDHIEEMVNGLEGFIKDLINIDAIDWDELREHAQDLEELDA
jgi:hypothetical protein